MAYIGATPTAVPLTGADIEDGTIQIADLSATGTKDATTFLRGDGTFASAGGSNTPAFEASATLNQDSAYAVFAKVNFETELFDTDSCYDNSTNYRFTPTTAGKYFVYSTVFLGSTTNNEIDFARIAIYKNGTEYKRTAFSPDNSYDADKIGISVHTTIDMNGTSDYLEVYYYVDTSAGTNQKVFGNGTLDNVFGAYKLIGV